MTTSLIPVTKIPVTKARWRGLLRLAPEGVAMRGKLVILLILALAVAATAGAWWHRYQAGRRALGFWGPEAARRIRNPEHIQLLRLSSSPRSDSMPSDAGPTAGGMAAAAGSLPEGLTEARLEIDGVGWWVVDWQDISQAAGVVHARHSLIQDASFVWDSPRGNCGLSWSYAWRFVDGSGQTMVLLDLDCDRIRTLRSPREVGLQFGDGLRTFCEEQFAD